MSRSLPLCLICLACFLHPLAADEVLPEDAKAVIEALDRDLLEVQRKFEEQVRELTDKHIAQLQKLQDQYTRDGKLDEALAIRDRLRFYKAGGQLAYDDPGTLVDFKARIGDTVFFRVTGATDGTIYGSDVYTADSPLATAAVHAGVLKYGETAIVKVTILPGKNRYEASDRNEVTSQDWGEYPKSFRVEPMTPPERREEPPAPMSDR